MGLFTLTLALRLHADWARFAATGDPNADGAPTWPEFAPDAADDDLRLQFDPAMSVLESFRKEECGFWRSGYAH